MKTPKFLKSVFAALCAAFAVSHAGAAGFALTPSSTTIAAGSTFSLDLVGTDLADLYAFQFALSFDPAIVHVLGVTEGPALPTAGTTFFVPGAADNVAGMLALSGDTLIGPIPGFTGGGTLASISFAAVAGGTTSISFSDVLTLSSAFDVGVPTLESANVAVTGTSPVPEPSTTLLMAIGLGAVAGFARRRRG